MLHIRDRSSQARLDPLLGVVRWLQQHIWKYILFILFITAVFLHLDNAPPLWWDEGWTLTVARNWVQFGHFGQFLNGIPAPRGLDAAFPVTVPVALSFQLLGVGVWQGRLVGVLFTLGALGLVFYLADRLYDRKIAWGTMFVLLLMTGHPQINPLLNGRQVLADVPVVFYLLAGFALFIHTEKRPALYLPLAAVMWGLAICTKIQALPFWLLSLALPFIFAILQRAWRIAAYILIGLVGSWLARAGLIYILSFVLSGRTIPGNAVPGLFSLVGAVLDLRLRMYALNMVLLFVLPLACGLLWGLWLFVHERQWRQLDRLYSVSRISLLILSGSWFAWYLLLSNGGERYLASPAMIGGIFTAKMLADLTGGYQVRRAVSRIAGVIRLKDRSIASISTLCLLILLVFTLSVTSLTYFVTFMSADNSAQQAADYLNHSTEPRALIESYDPEVFFFLDRLYHFPPDNIHGDLLRRYLIDPDHAVAYDPLAADPDYLVVGPVGSKWRLYDPVIESGDFQRIYQVGAYIIYERQH